MSDKKFDVIIIGGGNAGFGVSSVAHEAGKSIAFIEARDFGGTCPNRGCTPKKVLVAAAHTLDEIARAEHHGITVGQPKLDWKKLIERKDDMIGFIPDAMHGVAKKRGETFVGRAKFVGKNLVQVGDHVLEGENIVVATGSTPRPLPIPGAEHLITSEEVLSEAQLPEEVVFIGGGVVALEFSHVYARAGVKVTILEVAPRLLPRMDAEAVEQLHQFTESLGVTIKTGVKVLEVGKTGERLSVRYEEDGVPAEVSAQRVVNGAGRVANVAGLDLDVADVKHNGVGIEVHPHLQSTSNPAIWVAGDALVTSPQLSPLATYEGQIVGRNIVNGSQETPDYTGVPSAVYTVPSFATVGLTEEQAKEAKLDVRVSKNDLTSWFSGKSYAEKIAYSKVLVDEKADRIVGAHLIGHHADDLIHIFSLAIKHQIPVSALKSSIYAFPSFASDVKNLL